MKQDSIVMTDFTKLDKEYLMPLKEFIRMCKDGFFIDYDGFGYYATDTQVSNVYAQPSDICRKSYKAPNFTHVCWYNK